MYGKCSANTLLENNTQFEGVALKTRHLPLKAVGAQESKVFIVLCGYSI